MTNFLSERLSVGFGLRTFLLGHLLSHCVIEFVSMLENKLIDIIFWKCLRNYVTLHFYHSSNDWSSFERWEQHCRNVQLHLIKIGNGNNVAWLIWIIIWVKIKSVEWFHNFLQNFLCSRKLKDTWTFDFSQKKWKFCSTKFLIFQKFLIFLNQINLAVNIPVS